MYHTDKQTRREDGAVINSEVENSKRKSLLAGLLLLLLGLLLFRCLLILGLSLALGALGLLGGLLLLSLLLGLLGLALEVLLAENLEGAVLLDADLATLEAALELVGRHASGLSETLKVLVVELLLGLLVLLLLLLLLGLLLRDILHLLIRIGGGILHLNLLDKGLVGSLSVSGHAVSIDVVLASLLDVPLGGSSDGDTVGADRDTLAGNGLALELAEVVLKLGARADTKVGASLIIGILGELGKSIGTDTKGDLGGELTSHLTLVGTGSLANERSVVDETILGSGVLGLEGTEKGLLGTENLDGRTGVLGKVHDGTSVGNETSTDKSADELGHVGSNGAHAVLEVVRKLLAVDGVVDDALSEVLDVLEILLGNLSTHGNIGGGLDGSLNLVGKNLGQIGGGGVRAHAHGDNDASIRKVVGKDLGQLGEVPAVPFLDTHGVGVELLVKLVEERDGVNDHDIDLLGGELELVARERVRETEGHLLEVLWEHARNELREILADGTEEVGGGGVGNGLDVEAGNLVDGSTELGLSNGEGDLLLTSNLGKQAVQLGGDLALNNTGDFLKGRGGALELGELLVLDPVGTRVGQLDLGGCRPGVAMIFDD